MAKDESLPQDPYYSSSKARATQIVTKYSQTVIEAVVYTESEKIKRITFKQKQNPDNTSEFYYTPRERFVILEILKENKPVNQFDIFLTSIEVYFKNTKSTSYHLIQKDSFREVNKTIVFPNLP